MQAANIEEPDVLGEAIAGLLESRPNPFFVQIGGFDGVSFDPLRPHIVDQSLRGLIVEPIPQYFAELKALYANSPNITTVNCAITEANGERTIWRFNPLAVERGLLPPHFAGISSFLMEDLLKETGVLGRSSPNKETTAALRTLLQPVAVQCRTMDSLLRDQGIDKVDILQVDTEGYDYIILKHFDFARYRPAIVHYEHQHLNPADREAAEALLRSRGYGLHRGRYDTLAVLDAAKRDTPSRAAALRELALSLDADGRAKDALLVLEHLAAVHPRDVETLRALVQLLAAQGLTLAAIEKMVEMRDVASDAQPVLDSIQAHAPAAIELFNRHLAAGEIAEAEKYASVLATLIPRNKAFLEAARACNSTLGRTDSAAKYAAALLSLTLEHSTASPAPTAADEAPLDTESQIEDQIAHALSPKSDLHPLVRLRDIHDLASAILSKPIGRRDAQQVEELVAASRALVLDLPQGSEWEGWEKHYRLMLGGIDLTAVTGAPPAAAREPAVKFVTCGGVPATWPDVQAAAARLDAEVVFFAAADEAYVDSYARWYIKSIVKHSDVPCLVIVHVIGGMGRLREVAKSLGIRDRRLFFSSDDFDPAKVTAECYDAPPKGRSEKPIAHLQSIRFLRLGHFLRKLKRPIFVSDIDLVLQRGVKDLLQRAADTDVMINRNETSRHAGSQLTANLLLVNPTDNAILFLRFLRDYLERALAKPAVTRWIDQLSLLMAQHHLSLRGKAPRIDCFDTRSDINNVMYPSYQENPFRFLSLYQGFDTSSLESHPEVAGDVGQAKRGARSAKRAVARRKRQSRAA